MNSDETRQRFNVLNLNITYIKKYIFKTDNYKGEAREAKTIKAYWDQNKCDCSYRLHCKPRLWSQLCDQQQQISKHQLAHLTDKIFQ